MAGFQPRAPMSHAAVERPDAGALAGKDGLEGGGARKAAPPRGGPNLVIDIGTNPDIKEA